MKKNRTKVKHTNRPPGVPYNNKKMPLDCHVCRVVTEEIENIIKDDKKQLDPEGEKNRKRENRRKKKDSSTQKSDLLQIAITTVCNNMKDYIPQEDRTKFRYISKSTLKDTMHLTLTSSDPARAEKMDHEFGTYVHPETSRLEYQCKRFVRSHKKDILEWHENNENKTSIVKFVCEDRVLQNDPTLTQCLAKENARDDLWTKTFDSLKAYQHILDEL
ncbi:uncharacterized protein LOC120343557 isoform X2 [Styela clava]